MCRRIIWILPIVLLTIFTACEAPVDPLSISTEVRDSSVSTPLKSFTITVGESRVLPVKSINAAGTDVSYNFSVDNETSVLADIQLGNLVVKGLEVGNAALTLSNSAGAAYTVSINVLEEGVYDTGELYLRYITEFTVPWDSSGIEDTIDMRACDPDLPEGWHSLGSIHVVHPINPTLPEGLWMMAVRDRPDGNALAEPEGYTRAWQDAGVSVWKPNPPTGYVALGVLVWWDHLGTPGNSEMVCVREDLTRPATYGVEPLWRAEHGGLDWSNFHSILPPTDAEPDPGHFYLASGSIICNSHQDSSWESMNVLHLPILVAEEYNDDEVPHLESYDNPGPRTKTYLGRSIMMPFHMVTDGAYDVSWKLANSPFYRIRREDYYRNICFYDNQDGSLQESAKYTVNRGIGAEKSNTFSSETSLSLTASYGAKAVGASYEVTLTQTFGYATTASTNWSQETSISNSMNVPPGKCAILWDKTTGFTVERRRWYNEAWQWQPLSYVHDGQAYDDFSIGMSSVRKSEYPRF